MRAAVIVEKQLSSPVVTRTICDLNMQTLHWRL
jgi:hypothetical protein